MSYAYNKKWRLSHPKTRLAGKKRYYQKTQAAPNCKKLWTTAEMDAITADDRPFDSVLAKQLGRSVKAIHVKRAKINKKEN